MTQSRFTLRHVLVRLVSGPVYQEETDLWHRLLLERDEAARHYHRMGLDLVVDEDAGYAFLRQGGGDETEDEAGDETPPASAGPTASGEAPLPRLLRRTPLGFLQTVLLVELRERLLRHDQSADGSEHLYLEAAAISAFLAPYCGEGGNEQKVDRQVQAAIRRLTDLGILRAVANRGATIYRVEPILRAKLPVDRIEEIRKRLLAHAGASGEADDAAAQTEGDPSDD